MLLWFSTSDDIPEEEKYTVSALIERANKNAGEEELQVSHYMSQSQLSLK